MLKTTHTTGRTDAIPARAIVVTILLVSYGALGARQPAVRTSVPLPVPVEQLAGAFGLDPGDRSQLFVSLVRLVFDAPDGSSREDQKRRAVLSSLLKGSATGKGDRVPLPLDTSIWRETLLPPGDSAARIAFLLPLQLIDDPIDLLLRHYFSSRAAALMSPGILAAVSRAAARPDPRPVP